MKATPVPFIKYWVATPCLEILMPLVKAYKKIENYLTGLRMFIHHTSLVNNLRTLFLDFP